MSAVRDEADIESGRAIRNNMAMKFILAAIVSISPFLPAYAQVQPSSQTTELVGGVTEAFFELLLEEDFARERAFLTDELAKSIPIEEWRNRREQVIEAAGPTPRYAAHGLSYYQNKQLLAAVDFSGQAAEPNTYICGYLLWKLPSPNIIGLTRFEQNIVSVDLFSSMPLQDAAQLMTNWRCPSAVIETVLGVSVQ